MLRMSVARFHRVRVASRSAMRTRSPGVPPNAASRCSARSACSGLVRLPQVAARGRGELGFAAVESPAGASEPVGRMTTIAPPAFTVTGWLCPGRAGVVGADGPVVDVDALRCDTGDFPCVGLDGEVLVVARHGAKPIRRRTGVAVDAPSSGISAGGFTGHPVSARSPGQCWGCVSARLRTLQRAEWAGCSDYTPGRNSSA